MLLERLFHMTLPNGFRNMSFKTQQNLNSIFVLKAQGKVNTKLCCSIIAITEKRFYHKNAATAIDDTLFPEHKGFKHS